MPFSVPSRPRARPPSIRLTPGPISLALAVRLLIVVSALGALLVWAPPEPAAAETHPITLPIDPQYLDEVYWSDTWGAPRSGGRSHIGVDMLGPKMVPLIAANDGEVTWGRFDNDRGTIVRFRDYAGYEYQYIHINNDTPGTDDGNATCRQALSAKLCDALDGDRIRRGTPIQAGELIGYLGDSGNAEWTAPHLHFEVYQPEGDDVVPVNPTPFVDAAADRARTDPGEPVGPFADAVAAANEIYQRLEGRAAGDEERNAVRSAAGRGGLHAVLAEVAAGNPSAAMLDRLYLAFFQRYPDTSGWDHWIDTRSQGHRLEDIAEWFAESEEFLLRYGDADFSDFLDLLYADVLDRAPDEEGKAYWLNELADGRVTRGTIVVYFTESVELRSIVQWRSELTVIHRALGLERPTDAEIEAWRLLRVDRDIESSVAEVLAAS
ncbi:MAG: DUF4214 domain-containing protein [Actinomycetota bacterium]